MKINNISTFNQKVKNSGGNKITKLAYSSIFALSLFSAANTALNSTQKDSFTKNKPEMEETGKFKYIDKPTVTFAQSIYTDGYGNQWVRYSDYQKKYKEYQSAESNASFYEERRDNHISDQKETAQEIKAYIEEIAYAEQRIQELQNEIDNLNTTKEDVDELNGALHDIPFGVLGGIAGVIIGLITKGLYILACRFLGIKR